MKKTAFAATITALFTFTLQASELFTYSPQANDTTGLYLGGQIWQNEANGSFGEKDTLVDLNLGKEQQSYYFVAVEHPFSFLPNVRIAHTSLETSGKTHSTQTISVTPNAITHTSIIDTDIEDSVNISYLDYTLYFELFNNGLFSFDLGVTARDFDGAITVTEATTTVSNWQDIYGTPYTATKYDNSVAKINTDDIEPMLYVATNIRLPLTGLSIFGQGDFLLRDERTISDYQVGLSYDLVDSRVMDLTVTLGYRVAKMEFEGVDNLYTELEFKGASLGMIARF